ncbi:MAG: lyase family protein, partial [Acidimicrobiia bacterium]
DELGAMSEVDRAHLVMLAERHLVPTATAAAILAEIMRLRSVDFAPLRNREARRGLYLLYEDWLVSRLGERTAGSSRLGRSRNDLNATVFLLRLRAPYQRLMAGLCRLQAVLLRGARRHRGLVMPAYTHYQPAFPTTFGHYLAGVALALDRDLAPLAAAAKGLECCPLGAGAGGGTGVAIDPARTAALLGFSSPVRHSLDAVATREPALRLLAGLAVAGVTLSRVAADLLTWTTAEFGFLWLPDELVGSSSALPQKRNPFLLEHVKGRSAAPLGSLVAAAGSLHAAPFANSVAVGGEGAPHVFPAVDAITDAAVLLGLVLAGAQPRPEPMARRARHGFTTAAALAEQAVARDGLSYREAHHLIGRRLTDDDQSGGGPGPPGESGGHPPTPGESGGHPRTPGAELPDPADVVAAAVHGGGPGASPPLTGPRGRRAAWAREVAVRDRRWDASRTALNEAVAELTLRERTLASVGRPM